MLKNVPNYTGSLDTPHLDSGNDEVTYLVCLDGATSGTPYSSRKVAEESAAHRAAQGHTVEIVEKHANIRYQKP